MMTKDKKVKEWWEDGPVTPTLIREKEILGQHGEDVKYNKYIKVCENAVDDEEAFQNFKINPDYNSILEHTPIQAAIDCLRFLKKHYPSDLRRLDWDLVRENDNPTKTTVVSFHEELKEIINSETMEDFMFAPTTIYYLWAAFEIINHIKSNNEELNPLSFVEIGCGYGGQCLMVHVVADLYKIKIKSYSLVDLFQASELQKKYLRKVFWPGRSPIYDKISIELAKNCDFVKCLAVKELGDLCEIRPDMVISNYCFSETSSEWGKIYMENIIKKSKQGFFLWNNKSSVGEIREDVPSVEDFGKEFFPNLVMERSVPDAHKPHHDYFCRLLKF